MPIAKYQKAVEDWVQGFTTPYWSPLSQLATLSEEVGELARILNHKYGDKIKKATEEPDDLLGEMGDILFALICLANTEGLDLDEAILKTLKKVHVRDIDRFQKKIT